MENKDLNTNGNYNQDYNIHFSFHVSDKVYKGILDFGKIEQTIIYGKNVPGKTKYPKLCKRFYFGKENETYFAIFVKTKGHIRVITSWKKKGN